MNRAQIFTLDLVMGSVIILSILSTTYTISTYYSTINSSLNIKSNIINSASSAASAFALVGTTDNALVQLHSTGNTAIFLDYVKSTLGAMLTRPYSISIQTKSDYGTSSAPNITIFNYTSPGFSDLSYSSFYEPVIVSDLSTLCYSNCDPSLSIKDVFAGQNATLNAPYCTVFYNNGTEVPWTVLNDTTGSECTIKVSSAAYPQNYLVNAFSSPGTFEGNTTLYVLALDLIHIKAGT